MRISHYSHNSTEQHTITVILGVLCGTCHVQDNKHIMGETTSSNNRPLQYYGVKHTAAAQRSAGSIVCYGVWKRQRCSTTTKHLWWTWTSSVNILQVVPVSCSTGTTAMSTIILPQFSGGKCWDGWNLLPSLASFSFLCFRLTDPLSARFSILKTHCAFDPQRTRTSLCQYTLLI